jgi:hypothetical protein
LDDAEEADKSVTAAETFVPRSQLEPLTVVSPAQNTVMPPVVVQAASVAVPQGPAADRFEVAQIVQQVTRTLAWRDLDALQAGREVVLHLDESLMPQTVLTFRPAVAGPGAAGSAQGAEVVVSLQTQSPEVREFLDTHGAALVQDMARQAPGLRWAPTPELAWQGAASAGPAGVAGIDPELRTGDAVPVVAASAGASAQGAGQGAAQGDGSPSSDQRSGS